MPRLSESPTAALIRTIASPFSSAKNSQIIAITDFGVGDNANARMESMARHLGIGNAAWISVPDVKPFSILNGAARIAALGDPRRLPKQSSVAAVVDPHVGPESVHARIAILLRDEIAYIGPDNGVFSPILTGFANRIERVYTLDIAKITDAIACEMKLPPNRTFHGESVFGPMAALHSRKGRIADWAKNEITDLGSLQKLAIPNGTIVDIDAYGNLKMAIGEIPTIETGMRLRVRLIRANGREFELIAPIHEGIVNGEGRHGEFQLVRQGSSVSPTNPHANCLELFKIEENAAAAIGAVIGDRLVWEAA